MTRLQPICTAVFIASCAATPEPAPAVDSPSPWMQTLDGLVAKRETISTAKSCDVTPQDQSKQHDLGIRCEGKMLRSRVVKAAIYRKLENLQACYQSALDRGSTIEGRIVMRFGIASDGQTKDVCHLESTLSDPVFELCLHREIATIGIERNGLQCGSDLEVTYSLVFEPQ